MNITLTELVSRYEVILLDAFGVLNDADGALPAGRRFLDEIRAQNRRFFVVTNDASRLPSTSSERFFRFGLDIPPDAIITSGSLLPGYFAENRLQGARCMVLGPEDSLAYVREAGGEIVPLTADQDCDAVIVCDDDGYPFLDAIDDTLSAMCRCLDRGKHVHRILPNPDLIYPKRNGGYGFTAGGVALLFEAALERRYPGRNLHFTRLGKPYRPLFDEARRRSGTGSMVMVGDQIETDIAGAKNAGIAAALVTTGISLLNHTGAGAAVPDYVLDI